MTPHRAAYKREWSRRRRESQRQPLRAGGLCVYRTGEASVMRVVSIRDGVAKVECEGRSWDEAVAYLRGVAG